MIVNDFRAMQFVRARAGDDLTPALVCELHRIVTEGTLDKPDAVGRLQLPDEPRVGVWAAMEDVQLHQPPPASELPGRLARLCAFANGTSATGWMPPLLRAIITHFMTGYDHYFVLYQLKVIRRAIDELHDYLARKAAEARSASDAVSSLGLNHRQVAIVEGALRDDNVRLTAQSHATSHGVTLATARSDLRSLERLGLLTSHHEGRAEVWRPVPHFSETLATVNLSATDS